MGCPWSSASFLLVPPFNHSWLFSVLFALFQTFFIHPDVLPLAFAPSSKSVVLFLPQWDPPPLPNPVYPLRLFLDNYSPFLPAVLFINGTFNALSTCPLFLLPSSSRHSFFRPLQSSRLLPLPSPFPIPPSSRHSSGSRSPSLPSQARCLPFFLPQAPEPVDLKPCKTDRRAAGRPKQNRAGGLQVLQPVLGKYRHPLQGVMILRKTSKNTENADLLPGARSQPQGEGAGQPGETVSVERGAGSSGAYSSLIVHDPTEGGEGPHSLLR